MPCGKTVPGRPAIIWKAGIMSSRPATIAMPGAITSRASRSMMMPKDRPRRRPISQPRVKQSASAWSRSRCSTAEVAIDVTQDSWAVDGSMILFTPSALSYTAT